MEFPTARKMWRTLEPYHGMIYFVPEAEEAYAALGLTGRMGYFASRSAAMGPVPADVVIATFYNFHPDLVRRCIPEAWTRAEPAAILGVRLEAADRALRRLLPDEAEVEEAAELARTAAEACSLQGRPLYAGHAALPWPDEPHLVLWHAVTLLREFRGDGHVAALTAAGIGPRGALVLHGASGEVAPEVLRASREWPRAEWDETVRCLRDRGWLDADGAFTEAGRAARDEVEARTDELAAAPWDHLGEPGCSRLRELVRPWSRAIVEAGVFGLRAG